MKTDFYLFNFNFDCYLLIDQCQKNETKQRTKENLELKKILSSQNEETDEKFLRLEKEFNSKICRMKDQLHTTFDEFRDKVTEQIEAKLAEKLPEVFEKLNDMSAKMSLVFSDQREKVDAIEKKLEVHKEEVNHLINKTNDDLNRAVESNLEDTTQAVVNIRKEFMSQVKTEAEAREKQEEEIRSSLAGSVEKFSSEIEELQEKGRQVREKTQTEFDLMKGEIKQYKDQTEDNFKEIGEKYNKNNETINEQIKALGN